MMLTRPKSSWELRAEAAEAEVEKLRQERDRLRAALREIADTTDEDINEGDPAFIGSLRDVARAALSAAEGSDK